MRRQISYSISRCAAKVGQKHTVRNLKSETREMFATTSSGPASNRPVLIHVHLRASTAGLQLRSFPAVWRGPQSVHREQSNLAFLRQEARGRAGDSAQNWV